MALQVGASWLLALLAAVWAWRMPAPPEPLVSTARAGQAAPSTATATAIDVATWNINAWRPFIDEAVSVAPAAPSSIKLFSILQQGDGLIAAIAPGENAGLVYLKAGDTCNGFTVVRIEANGVVLRLNGQELRLGLGP